MTYERVLVTGASGFVGCRLAEHLGLGCGIGVRGLVHTAARAARLARLDVEIVQGDLLDAQSLRRAVDSCDAVVHCAYGTRGNARERRRTTGEGTRLLAEAARAAGVKRFVHLSTAVVHGFRPERRELDESLPLRRTRHPYCDGKIDAERAVAAAAARGLRAVVLRPTNVFGPWGEAFTVAPMRALREGRVALVGDGAGPANTLYVDNLAHAILLALEREAADGQTFLVSDGDGVTWRGLYEAYAQLASPPWKVRSLSVEELRRLRRRPLRGALAEARALARSPEAKALVRAAAEWPALRAVAARAARLLPGGTARIRTLLGDDGAAPESATPPTAAFPSEELAALQTSGHRVGIDKARSLLGYEPPVDFETAIRLTGEWLRFARLV